LSNHGVRANLAKKILDLVTTLVDVGELRISKTSIKGGQGARYLLYLPSNRAYLWKTLYESRAKLRVFIDLPEELNKIETEKTSV
jgi:hypothetical protein